jgi:hypothetical protein
MLSGLSAPKAQSKSSDCLVKAVRMEQRIISKPIFGKICLPPLLTPTGGGHYCWAHSFTFFRGLHLDCCIILP